MTEVDTPASKKVWEESTGLLLEKMDAAMGGVSKSTFHTSQHAFVWS